MPETPDNDKLTQLSRELYARDESENLTARQAELKTIGIRRQALPATPTDAPPTAFADVIKLRSARRRRWLAWGIGITTAIVLIVAAIAGTVWYRLRQNVKPEQIALTLNAPAEFTTGEEITYTAHVRNDSYVTWERLELVFEAPKGFRLLANETAPTRVGKNYGFTRDRLDPGGTYEVTITGQLLGEYNASLVGKLELVFTPENFPSGRFTKSAIASTLITTVPIEVSIDATDEVQSGERIVATIHVRNNSARTIDGAYLALNPAAGMQVAPDDPQFSPGFSSGESVWQLESLAPLTQITRTAIVYAEGSPSDRRSLEAVVGVTEGEDTFVQRTQSHVITITASALSLEQTYNDSQSTLTVAPGEIIGGVIHYKNIGTNGLKNVVITTKIEGDGFDPATLALPSGAYDPTTRTITWTAATVPALATLQPRQEGSLQYQFEIRAAEAFPATEAAKNQTVVLTATIDSPDVVTPTGQQRNLVSDRTVLSVATTMPLQVDAFYDDGRLGLKSDGPLPPRAGQQTTYTLRFRLGSTLNDIGGVRMVAVLPDGVRYTGKSYLTNGEVAFNDRSGEVVWSIPLLAGLSGRARPSEELHLQVAITPGEHQRGNTITFLNRLAAEGTDIFTDQLVTTNVKAFPTTATAVKEKGSVE